MKIGELAKKSNCQTVTIRYYEKEGLLEKPERTHSNYRMYSQEDLKRLKFVLHCRKHGIKLDDIRKLLTFRDEPDRDCTAIGELIDKHMQTVKDQISSLVQLKKGLLSLRSKCSGGHSSSECTIIQNLDDQKKCCP